MTKDTKIILIALVAILIISIVFGSKESKKVGATPNGIMATVATSTNPAVSTTPVVIFASSTCSSRTITTQQSAIRLTLSDYNGATPSGTFGVLQPASTTKEYDSAQYGCGLVKAYSYASDNLTVLESR